MLAGAEHPMLRRPPFRLALTDSQTLWGLDYLPRDCPHLWGAEAPGSSLSVSSRELGIQEDPMPEELPLALHLANRVVVNFRFGIHAPDSYRAKTEAAHQLSIHLALPSLHLPHLRWETESREVHLSQCVVSEQLFMSSIHKQNLRPRGKLPARLSAPGRQERQTGQFPHLPGNRL